MHEYNRVTGKPLDPLGFEPVLTDFYTPSNSQKDCDITFIIQGMTATGLIAYKQTMSDTTAPAFPKPSDFASNLSPGKWTALETKVYKLIKITSVYTKYDSSAVGTLLDEEGITRHV